MAVDPVRSVLSKLGPVRKAGKGWSARCPAHDDRNPSLAVSEGEGGRVLINCHAGCDLSAVLAALGLTERDLFAENGDVEDWTPAGPAIATYYYTDEHGKTLFGVCRTADKQFRQWRPDGSAKHGRRWSLDGIERVLYRLPKVLEAARNGGTVYVVEGEKDVHNLEAAGAVATCNPQGAGKWRDSYADSLRGAHVIVVADRDDAGRVHAARVAQSLNGIAASVKLVEPAEGKDATDHLAAGRTLDELVPMRPAGEGAADNGQVRVGAKVGRVVTLADVTPERVRWRWRPYLAAGKLTLVDGDPGDGKSTLTVDLAARYTTGSPMPDGAANDGPGDVLILSAEDGIADTIRPRVDAAGGDVARVHVLAEVEDDGHDRPPDLTTDLDVLRATIEAHSVQVVVIDPLMAFLGGDVDSHRDQDVRRVLHPLAKLAEATGATFLVVRHLNKSGGAKAVYRGGGSIGIIGAARLAYLVAPDPEDDARRVLAPTKLNIAAPPPALAYRIVKDEARDVSRIVWEGHTAHSAGDLLRTLDDDERTERDEAADWLRDYLSSEGGQALAADVKKAAREAGIAVRTMERARVKIATVSTAGFPRRSTWVLKDSDATATPPSQRGVTGDGGATEAPQGVPGDHEPQSRQSRQLRQPPETGTTEDADSADDAWTTADVAEPCVKCGQPAFLRLDGRPQHKEACAL